MIERVFGEWKNRVNIASRGDNCKKGEQSEHVESQAHSAEHSGGRLFTERVCETERQIEGDEGRLLFLLCVKDVGIQKLGAIGAYAVGKFSLGMRLDISFKQIPIARIIADLLAVRADRNKSPQDFDVGDRLVDFSPEDFFVSQKLPDSNPVRAKGDSAQDNQDTEIKPTRLVIMRLEYKRIACTGLIPHSIVVAGHDAEAVLARREVCVIRGSPCAGLDPLVLIPFKHVFE